MKLREETNTLTTPATLPTPLPSCSRTAANGRCPCFLDWMRSERAAAQSTGCDSTPFLSATRSDLDRLPWSHSRPLWADAKVRRLTEKTMSVSKRVPLSNAVKFCYFFPPISVQSSVFWLAPYVEAEHAPLPLPRFRPRDRQSRWLT